MGICCLSVFEIHLKIVGFLPVEAICSIGKQKFDNDSVRCYLTKIRFRKPEIGENLF